MRKTILLALILSIVFLSGCFGFFKKQTPQKPAADEQQAQSAPSAKNSQAQIPEPPSFQDGDYYLQAVAARSVEACGNIKNERLQAKCAFDVDAILKQQ
ncbi:hypothetical protein HYW83_01145 [Candidatus Peregrinibacteria bacterium]|nr:hypothetical protein [Candidatus Peregrinibacteria bacterium]